MAFKLFQLVLLVCLPTGVRTQAAVRVFVQEDKGMAAIQYECTAGEVVRSFALDVWVDRGQITGITNYFRGESKAGATGYGVFPASFRDHITVIGGTNVNWDATGYSPLAVANDDPKGTLPGLNSTGVTLEFGALWNPRVPQAMPAIAGTLCELQLSQSANVSVGANASRGGILSAIPGSVITTVFSGGAVGPSVTSAKVQNGVVTVLFQGGELQVSTSPVGQWTSTGNSNGSYTAPIQTNQMKFYRVRSF